MIAHPTPHVVAAFLGLVLLTAVPARAIVYTPIADTQLTVAGSTRNTNAGSIAFILMPGEILDLGGLVQLPILGSLGVSLSTDTLGGEVSPLAGGNLASVQVAATASQDDADWTTVLQLGDAVSRSGFGSVSTDFGPSQATPASLYQFVRVVFAGDLTGKDSVGLTASVLVVPEPGVWAMIMAGLAGIGLIARRRLS